VCAHPRTHTPFSQFGPCVPGGQLHLPLRASHPCAAAQCSAHTFVHAGPYVPFEHRRSHCSPTKPAGHKHRPVVASHCAPFKQLHCELQYQPYRPGGQAESRMSTELCACTHTELALCTIVASRTLAAAGDAIARGTVMTGTFQLTVATIFASRTLHCALSAIPSVMFHVNHHVARTYPRAHVHVPSTGLQCAPFSQAHFSRHATPQLPSPHAARPYGQVARITPPRSQLTPSKPLAHAHCPDRRSQVAPFSQ
jgi:hypothetical protein